MCVSMRVVEGCCFKRCSVQEIVMFETSKKDEDREESAWRGAEEELGLAVENGV